MFKPYTALAVVLGIGIVALSTQQAAAHHGWNWTTGENIELTGVIMDLHLGNPHGRVTLYADGVKWLLEVGQPWRNARAGLKDGDLAEGVKITVSGEPSANPDEKRLKVERLWIAGTKYELYPERS